MGDQGKIEITSGAHNSDPEFDRALKTTQDYRWYDVSAKMDEEFDNKDKTLVLQYSVRHEQKIDCGGGYIKILPDGLDQKKFGGDSEYNVMFGPDVCGTSTRKTHVIFTYDKKEGKPTNYLHKGDVKVETDKYTHLYTLIVKKDNTYEVQIDGEKVEGGKLADKFDFFHSKEIEDPKQSKPSDWVDEKKIPDPEDKKPDGYDDIPKQIPDPEASKPDDWDDEDDGEWEAPQIDNPEFKGEWKAKQIANPAYKGVWAPKKIANPEFVDDDELYSYKSFAFVGIDVWQVKSGTIFDNLLITDDVDAAKAAADKLKTFQDGEKKQKEEK